MILRLEIGNYKLARRLTLDLEEFQVLVGPNGSGKSTVIDALVFLADLLRLGVQKTVRKRARTLRELTWNMRGGPIQFALEVKLPKAVQYKENSYTVCRYEIAVDSSAAANGLEVVAENLYLKNQPSKPLVRQLPLFPADWYPKQAIIHDRSLRGWKTVFKKSAASRYTYHAETTRWNFPFDILGDATGLQFVPANRERFYGGMFLRDLLLRGIQFLHLEVDRMRPPCPPDVDVHLVPDGSNLAAAVLNLQRSDPEGFEAWSEHVLLVLPEFSSVRVREREEDAHLVLELVKSNDVAIPTWLLSDGTLRLLALTLLAYLPGENQIYLIEEPENGIHPSAIDVVHQSLSSAYGKQIVVATHSALFVGLTKPDQLLCFGKTEEGAIDVVRGSSHPRLSKGKGEVDSETLYASAVLDSKAIVI